MPLFRWRKRNQFDRRPRRRLSEAIPQRYQWAIALATVSLIISTGLGYEVMASTNGFWGLVWRAFAAGAIITGGAYGCYRICRK